MRRYLFGTGIITAVMGGITLLRGLRSEDRFTWRVGLAWLSWGISLALAIGTIVDTRRASMGKLDRHRLAHRAEGSEAVQAAPGAFVARSIS